jgi:hypothetical protein|tara:strand:- start:153 stop:380 length:228 start_codon:yes stop_codon:yes gene_type:complete
MNISRLSVSADTFLGAIIDSPRFGEVTVVGVEFDLSSHEVMIIVDQLGNGRTGIEWGDLKDATIHLQSQAWTQDS